MVRSWRFGKAVLVVAIIAATGCSDDPSEPPVDTPSAARRAYADEHYDIERLAAAYGIVDEDHLGSLYYGVVSSYTDLPLWVSPQENAADFYENIGRWGQFVFGWDDFVDPRSFLEDPDEINIENLDLPGVSAHREFYNSLE